VLIVGGVLGLIRMFTASSAQRVAANMQSIFLQSAVASPRLFDAKTDSADRLPYAWAIGLGALLYGVVRMIEIWTWM
jgi:hypothetical protein